MLETCEFQIQSTTTNLNLKPNIKKLTKLQRLEFILSTLNRLLIGFVTFYICWMCLRIENYKEIPWHAVCCTLGFLCLMSEGILSYYYGNSWTIACDRAEKTHTHWILQLCGSILGITGIVIKILIEEVHFSTLHGKFGLATFILCLWSLTSGLSSLYSNKIREFLQPLFNKAIHGTLGLMTYVLGICSMFTAFQTELFLQYSLDAAYYIDFRLLLKVFVICILVLTIYGPIWCLIYSKIMKCC